MSPACSRCTPSTSALDRSHSERSNPCHSTCRSHSRSGSPTNHTSSLRSPTGGCRTRGWRLVCRWQSPGSGSTSGRVVRWASTTRRSNSSSNCRFRPICRRTGRCWRHSRGGRSPWASVACSANPASISMARCGPMRAAWWLNSSIVCAAPAVRRRRGSRLGRHGHWHRQPRPGSPMPPPARLPKRWQTPIQQSLIRQSLMQQSQRKLQMAMGPTPTPASRPAVHQRLTRSSLRCPPT